jgi:hypothetical protein
MVKNFNRFLSFHLIIFFRLLSYFRDPASGLGSVNFLNFARTLSPSYPYTSQSQCPVASSGYRAVGFSVMTTVLLVVISTFMGVSL